MKNAINTTTIAATLVAAIASASVHAEGFSPWPDPSQAGAAQVGTRAGDAGTATPAAFYSAGLPRQVDRIDTEPFAVVVGPYYQVRS